jgi:hypothetical protein
MTSVHYSLHPTTCAGTILSWPGTNLDKSFDGLYIIRESMALPVKFPNIAASKDVLVKPSMSSIAPLQHDPQKMSRLAKLRIDMSRLKLRMIFFTRDFRSESSARDRHCSGIETWRRLLPRNDYCLTTSGRYSTSQLLWLCQSLLSTT